MKNFFAALMMCCALGCGGDDINNNPVDLELDAGLDGLDGASPKAGLYSVFIYENAHECSDTLHGWGSWSAMVAFSSPNEFTIAPTPEPQTLLTCVLDLSDGEFICDDVIADDVQDYDGYLVEDPGPDDMEVALGSVTHHARYEGHWADTTRFEMLVRDIFTCVGDHCDLIKPHITVATYPCEAATHYIGNLQ